MTKNIDFALEYWEQGISTLPIKMNDKIAAIKWKDLQNRKQTKEEVERIFASHEGNIAFIAGLASENLACLDVEEKGLFKEYVREFTIQYGSTWIVESRRGGHIIFRTNDTVKSHRPSGKNYEILGQGHYHMAPLSTVLYEDGAKHTYEFVSKPDKIVVVEKETFFPLKFVGNEDKVVVEKVARYINEKIDLEECLSEIYRLSRNMDRFSIEVNGKNQIDKSRFDMAFIQTMVNRGARYQDIKEALGQTAVPTHYGSLFKNKGAYVADTNLKFSYEKAVNAGDSDEYISNAEAAEKLFKSVSLLHWKGRTALNDKAALLAHIQKFSLCKKKPWDISAREGAERSSLSRPCFTKCTDRLIGNNFLKKVKQSDIKNMKSSSYDFGEGCLELLRDLPYPQVNAQSDTNVCIWKDGQLQSQDTYGVFEKGLGLGKAAESVWQAIQAKPLKNKGIAEATGRHPSTVSKAVKRLIGNHLAEEINGLIHAVPDFDFKSLGEDLGTINIDANRRRQHDFEREKQREYLFLEREQWKNSKPTK